MKIRTVRDGDIPAITAIYNNYIAHSSSTFEEESLAAEQITTRVRKVTAAGYPWLVAEDDSGAISGYAYAGPFKERSAYRFTCETSIYIAPEHCGKGIGNVLYPALFDELSQAGIRTAIAIITLPNPGSEKLHRRLGFEQAGFLPGVGFKFGQWQDVSYWIKELTPSQAALPLNATVHPE